MSQRNEWSLSRGPLLTRQFIITSITLFNLSLKKKVSYVCFSSSLPCSKTLRRCDLVIERERIRTTVPIHEVVHEAPIIHQGQPHAPIPIQLFLNQFGPLDGVIPHDEIIKKILGNGKCVREGDVPDFGDKNLGNKV
jgi:hypothetical protein